MAAKPFFFVSPTAGVISMGSPQPPPESANPSSLPPIYSP